MTGGYQGGGTLKESFQGVVLHYSLTLLTVFIALVEVVENPMYLVSYLMPKFA